MYSTVLVHHKIVILLLLLKYVRCASAQLSSKKTEKRNEQRTTTSRRSVMELRHGTHRRRGETDMYGCRRFTVSRQHGCSGYAPSTAWPRWPIRFVSAEEKKAFIAKCPCKLIQLRSLFPNQNPSINNKHSSLYSVIESQML